MAYSITIRRGIHGRYHINVNGTDVACARTYADADATAWDIEKQLNG